jgi:hypothetical protein
MELLVANKEYLQNSHISLCIKDKNNEVGQCVLSLKDACLENGTNFRQELYYKGALGGIIEGNFRVVWPHALNSNNTVDVLKTGFLLKQGEKVKSWKRRWFVLHSNGDFCYFNSQKDKNPIKKFNVKGLGVHTNTSAGKQNCITIVTPKRNLIFCADDEKDMEKWMDALSSAIKAK